MKKTKYCVKWWDAYGKPHISSPMDEQAANVFAASMNAEQEATVFLIYTNEGKEPAVTATFEQALKQLPAGTYYDSFCHKTIQDLCYICLHELDLHAEGEYYQPLAMRKKYLKFIEKFGFHVEDARHVFNIGLGKTKADFPYFDFQ